MRIAAAFEQTWTRVGHLSSTTQPRRIPVICRADLHQNLRNIRHFRSTDNIRVSAVAEEGDVSEVFDEVDVKKTGAYWEGVIKGVNKGGVIISTGRNRGFCPFSKLDPSRSDISEFDPATELDRSYLVGQPIRCLVQEVDKKGRPILSEKAYYMSQALDYYKPGDLITGKVVGMEPYGVFVDVPSKDGAYHGVRGLIHISQLSWNHVNRPEDVVSVGDEVKAAVKKLRRASNQMELSLRLEDSDPLKESVSSLLPLEGELDENMTWELPQEIIPELNVIMEMLRLQTGIEDVQATRQADLQHKVSKDLELWLSKEEVSNGFTLVAWAGRTLQEIHVRTTYTREQMKKTLAEVLRGSL